jgi:hypothetical protein
MKPKGSVKTAYKVKRAEGRIEKVGDRKRPFYLLYSISYLLFLSCKTFVRTFTLSSSMEESLPGLIVERKTS